MSCAWSYIAAILAEQLWGVAVIKLGRKAFRVTRQLLYMPVAVKM